MWFAKRLKGRTPPIVLDQAKKISIEPSQSTIKAVGSLCLAWAGLEASIDKMYMALAKSRASKSYHMKSVVKRLSLTIAEARLALPLGDVEQLEAAKPLLVTANRDRNIIVHGLVHAYAVMPIKDRAQTFTPQAIYPNMIIEPCWTIFRGEDAGQNFPVSLYSANVVSANIEYLDKLVTSLNLKHDFRGQSLKGSAPVVLWPDLFDGADVYLKKLMDGSSA